MRRQKISADPEWLIWEGDDFPRRFHSDSVVFYLSEHIYFDSDEAYKKSLANQIRLEGLTESLGEAYKFIEDSWVTKSGYYFEDGDDKFPVYCEEDDPALYYDATFVEVAHVI